MLARDKDNNFCNFVVYSDDFGSNWKILGDVNVPGVPSKGDEPKTEELPDGSIILSSRTNGGRMYNIFKFTDAEKAEGSWGTHAFSGAENNGCLFISSFIFSIRITLLHILHTGSNVL